MNKRSERIYKILSWISVGISAIALLISIIATCR